MEKISLGDITVSVKLKINGRYGRTFIVLIKRKAYILKITDGFSEAITTASHMPHLFKLGTLNYDGKVRAYYLYKFIDGHFIDEMPILNRTLLKAFIEMAKEIDSMDYAITDIDAKNMIISKDGKIYFVDHDGILPKGIAFLRDLYPYSKCELHPLENIPGSKYKNNYSVPTEIYYLGAFLYDNFVKTNRTDSEEIEDIVTKMCEFDQTDRYRDFQEIINELNGKEN